MSFDTYREDNEDSKGTNGATPSQGGTPNPYGFPHPSQQQAPPAPAPTYGAAPAYGAAPVPQTPANPYGFPHPSQNQAPPAPAPTYGAAPAYGTAPVPQNPYGAPQAQYPYGAPQGQPTPPQSPYASAPQQAAQSPYSFNGYQQAQPAAPAKGVTVFGLTWAKNLVPNPATGGMPPAQAKSNVVAYVLWFFLGWIGVHQFYLGNTNRGLFNLTLFFFTMVLSFTSIPFSLIYTAYWIYEAVVLNDQTNEVNHGYIRKSIL